MNPQQYSELIDAETNPQRQMQILGGLLVDDDPLWGKSVPMEPAFELQTATEVLLLTCTMPGTETASPTERTIRWILGSLPEHIEQKVDIGSIKDVAENDSASGFRWVGFDPLGVTRDEDQDFRADIFIDRFDGRVPGLDFPPGRAAKELAGIEAFMALLLIPAVTIYPWSDRTITLPRLEGTDSRGRTGAVSFSSPGKLLSSWTTWWGYNYYGNLRAIPTIRELT